MFDIICYGTLCQDRIIQIPRLPEPGGSSWIQEDTLTPGGEALNSARALNGWGLRVHLLGTLLGKDDRADWLADFIRTLKFVDGSRLQQSEDSHTPYCLIMATPDGERTMFGRYFDIMRGQIVESLPDARVFTTEPYCGEGAIRAARLAKSANIPVVAMDALKTPDLAETADIIVTSSQETRPVESPTEAEGLAKMYAAKLRRTVILTAGHLGSWAAGPNGELIHYQKAFETPEVVDATGCGDVYRAGLVCGIALDWALQESMAFASAAAALNLLSPGGGAFTLSIEQTKRIADGKATVSEMLNQSG